jgi:hypothetical protein
MRTALLVVALPVALLAQSSPNLSFRGQQRPLHAAAVAGPADLAARPGAKATLFVDVTPNPNIHVYAPGAKDFIPITVKFENGGSAASAVRIGKLTYPKSDVMTFADEKVPVFEKPFRLTQEVTLAASLKPGDAVPIKASVDYQACDDKVCYPPESIPVTWTLTVR